jgi:hypothetical protein
MNSPVIEREGDKFNLPPNNVLTAGEWVQARYNLIVPRYAKRREGKDIGTTLIGNIEVKTYA